MSDEMKSTADNKQGKIAAEVIIHVVVNRFIVRVYPS